MNMRALFQLGLLTFIFHISSIRALAQAQVFPAEQRTEAKNAQSLYLFPQQGELLGWVSQVKEGTLIEIKSGEISTKIKPEATGRFSWKLPDTKTAKTVTLSYGKIERVVTIPAMETSQPVAFFVIDRSVCRVNTSFKFTAFLRQQGADSNYLPYTSKPIEVEIRSKTKGIVVAKLKLTPDAHGKIVGEYHFSKADPLDDYSVKCLNGIHGTAEVKLAEFRKAKVRLDISGERKAHQFKLTFKTLDFLGKPVPAGKLHFSAKIYRKQAPTLNLWGLKPTEFHGYKASPDRWYLLNEEHRALLKAGNPHVQSLLVNEVIHGLQKELELGDDGVVDYQLMLDPLWKKDCVIEITASAIDSNNREQTATKTIPLNEEQAPTLELNIDLPEVVAGKQINLTAKQKKNAKLPFQGVSFVVFELETVSKSPIIQQPYFNVFNSPPGDFPPASPLQAFPNAHFNQIIPTHNNRLRSARYIAPHQANLALYQLQRQFISMLVGQKTANGSWTSKLRLTRPGAYVIRAVSIGANGKQQETEEIVVVKPKSATNALHIHLDKEQLEAGQQLTGVIHSRYSNSKVLLIVRDARGIRAMQSLSLHSEKAPFRIQLPSPLSLGCSLTAMYSDDGYTLHQERKRFQVRPDAKKLKIKSKPPTLPAPGETVELNFQVDTDEEVDLVVSVYDKSLLGVAPHKPVDGLSLFYADTRVENDLAQKMVRQCLSGLTRNNLLRDLELLLKDSKFAESAQGKVLVDIKNYLKVNHLDVNILRKILAWKGAPIVLDFGYTYSNYWHIKLQEEDDDIPLSDLIQRRGRSGRVALDFCLRGGQLGVIIRDARATHSRVLFHELNQRQQRSYQYGGYYADDLRSGSGGFGIPTQRRGRSTRGDGSFSVTANASFSNLSGQAMISHMPASPVMPTQEAVSIRVNFSDSAFFKGNIRTDANGKATVKFKLPDSLTNWHVVVTAVSKDLSIGQHTATFKTYKPVMVWPMLAQSFTSGDRVKVFAKVHNLTDNEQEFTVTASAKNGTIHGEKERKVTLPAQSNKSVYFDYEAGKAGFTEILMAVTSKAGSDASQKRLPVYPCAAEQVITQSGFVKGSVDITIPEGIEPSQSQLEITISPSIAGDMLDSLDYLIDYPHGCVEQTMSRFLPVVKVAQILRENKIDDPALSKKVPTYAKAGIKRLLELQKTDGGWGWQGSGQTHEMMTPYALYGLIEAKKAGFEIPNETAIDRGLKRLELFIDRMGSNQAADRIYCMWVYSQQKPLKDHWWIWLHSLSNKTLSTQKLRNDLLSDYAAALTLEMSVKSRKTPQKDLAEKMIRLLSYRAKFNKSKGQAHWTTSGFSRWGNDHFEVSAAVLKALVAYDADHALVAKSLNYFAATKRGNRWNSTKDTAMILYAMCDYLSKQNVKLNENSSVTKLTINGKPHTITNPSWKPKKIIISGDKLQADRIQLLFTEGDKSHQYRLVYRYWKQGREVAAVNKGIKLRRTIELIDADGKHLRTLRSGDTVPKGAYIRSGLHTNFGRNQAAFALIVDPKISAAEFTRIRNQKTRGHQHYVLKEDKSAGTFWHYERANYSLVNVSTYRIEMSGKFLIAPAYAELMYDTAVRGNSDSFYLIVEDK